MVKEKGGEKKRGRLYKIKCKKENNNNNNLKVPTYSHTMRRFFYSLNN